MLKPLLAILACATLIRTQKATNSTHLACHEIFANCDLCDSKLTTCLQCNSGYFRLIPQPQDPSLSICVTDCRIFNSHIPDNQKRECSLDCPQECGSTMCGSDRSCSQPSSLCTGSYSFLTPSQECSQFACPVGYYRNSIEKSCGRCDSSCETCIGQNSNQCLSCHSDSYLSLTEPTLNHGKCQKKEQTTSDFTIFVSNAISIIDNGSTASDRTGQINNPFVDLRDALFKAQELASPFQNASVTIFLTKGTHYILLEQESKRYGHLMAPQHEFQYSLRVKPLPCGLYPSLKNACVASNEKVLVVNKIGAYLHFELPQSTTIERIHFDFADSLLEWGSTCQQRRTRSCAVQVDVYDNTIVTSLDPDCMCATPQILASTCNYKHELSFLTPPTSHTQLNPSQLNLSYVVFSNIYEHFNSLIGFDAHDPPNIVVEHSEFISISLCGPLVSSIGLPPMEPNDLLSLSFTRSTIQSQQHDNGSSIKIINSQFKKIGLAFQYEDVLSIKSSTYRNSVYDMTATVLALKGVALSIELRGNQITQNKINFDPLLPIDPTQTILFQKSLLLQKSSLIEQGLIVVKNHTRGILMEGNRFERNSGLRGLIVIEVAESYERGAVLYNNTFLQSSGLISAGVLNLRARYEANSVHSCSGFHVEMNEIMRTVLLKSDASVIYLTCIYDDFIHFDDLEEVSGLEYFSDPVAKAVPPLLTHQEYYQINNEQLKVDYSKTVLRSNVLAENLRFKNSGSMIVALFMRNLIIQDLSLIRNGDINVMIFYSQPSDFWDQFGGLQNSQSLRYLEFDELPEDMVEGFKDKLLFFGSIQNLLVDGVFANDNWWWHSQADELGYFITSFKSEVSDFLKFSKA